MFTSKLFKELTVLLQIQFKSRDTKTSPVAWRFGLSHAVLKKNLKVIINSPVVIWHNQVEIACCAHNMSFNGESKFTPALLFHGRHPKSALERSFNVGKIVEKTPQSWTNQDLQDVYYASKKFFISFGAAQGKLSLSLTTVAWSNSFRQNTSHVISA